MQKTNRLVIGQPIVCQGCCSGATHRVRPTVPSEWLKEESRKRGLFKRAGRCNSLYPEPQQLYRIAMSRPTLTLIDWSCPLLKSYP